MRRIVIVFGLLVAGAVSFAQDEAPRSYEEGISEWRAKRLDRLLADSGYLALSGLFWLQEGESSFGTDASCTFVLREGSAPARAGVFIHNSGTTTLRAEPGAEMWVDDEQIIERQLRSDDEGEPDVVRLGELTFYVIKRGDRFGIRMRDLRSPIRENFRGIENYPTSKTYKVVARFDPYVPPKKVPIASIIGTVDTLLAPGALVFHLNGKECRLDPIVETLEDDSYFIIFSDQTSGVETYGSGRFLYTDVVEDGQVVVDFNKAYNPPCAFSPFTTCPLPPFQNDLQIAVRAGEKKYTEH